MDSWVELSNRFIAAHDILANADVDGRFFECVVGPFEDLASEDVLAAFRRCSPSDAARLRAMLGDPRHRLFVKLLAFATECVPEVLFEDFLRAGVETDNPSFNKHFLFPLSILYGRRRVLASLLELVRRDERPDRRKVESALYWLSIPREQTYWPHAIKSPRFRPPPDEPIADLLEQIQSALG